MLAQQPTGLPSGLTAATALVGFTAAPKALHAQTAVTLPARAVAVPGAKSMPVYLAHVIALAGTQAALRLGIDGFGANLPLAAR